MPSNTTKEQAVTPEEKLFRLIAAAGKDDAELQDLLGKYAKPKRQGTGYFFGLVQKSNLSPVARMAALAMFGTLVFYFLSGIQVGRTFYMSPGARLGQVGIEHAVDFFPKYFQTSLSSPAGYSLNQHGEVRGLMKPSSSPQSLGGDLKVPDQTIRGRQEQAQVASVTLPVTEARPFRLVGISRDDQGPVAMIEVTGDARAKFIRQGETIDGEVRVETIKDYTVMLASGEKKWELT